MLLHILYLFYFSRQTNRKEKKKKNLDSRERALSAAIAENSIEVQGVKIPHFPLYFAGEFRYPPLVHNRNLSVPANETMPRTTSAMDIRIGIVYNYVQDFCSPGQSVLIANFDWTVKTCQLALVGRQTTSAWLLDWNFII